MNMQASPDLDALVQQQMNGETCVLMQAVVDELERLVDVSSDPRAVDLARKTLANLAWLGPPHRDDDWADLEDIVHWQDQVADGRPLKHEGEHWAESVIIAAIERLPEDYDAAVFLSDEYSARVQATKHEWCHAYSLVRYLHVLVRNGTLSASVALRMATELADAGRGIAVELSDFTDPSPKGLGRYGGP